MQESDKFKCRFYREKYPEVDECCIVRVNEITEMGAYVSLLEYNNIEGMILLSELSRRRIRAISRFIRVGKTECVMVMRVNKEKGYIDLSKSRVSPEEEEACKIRFHKGKSVHNIMYHVAKVCDVPMIELYENIGWPLFDEFGNGFDALKLLANDKMEVIKDIKFPSMKVREEFLKIVKKRLKPQDVKIRSDLEVTCFAYGGIISIKKALKAGREVILEDGRKFEVNISLLAPPRYVLTYIGKVRQEGVKIVEKSIEQISKVLQEEGGKLTVKVAPNIVSAEDEKSLESLMAKLSMQNQEVSGDDDEDQF